MCKMIKILLADDNPINLQLATLSLRKIAESIEFAANGEEAVSKFEKGNFDVILMDVQMPRLDGFEATRRIRAIEKLRDSATPIPIIALTASSSQTEISQGTDAGMVAFLPKPINALAAQKLIYSLLEDRD